MIRGFNVNFHALFSLLFLNFTHDAHLFEWNAFGGSSFKLYIYSYPSKVEILNTSTRLVNAFELIQVFPNILVVLWDPHLSLQPISSLPFSYSETYIVGYNFVTRTKTRNENCENTHLPPKQNVAYHNPS